ncbi:MAG TPA: BamA/TamA family outer membrane protein, partial [Vicinamibacterales bacterium]|nr:BamA/TamA family outer membrane protein [Vicinamibacterales bacterium]
FSQTASPEVITDIRVQGNVLTPDAEMIGLTGVAIGAPFTPDLPRQIADRLKATHKFESVQVLKRYASIEDASKILLVVIVNEGPVKDELFEGAGEPRAARVVKRHGFGTLWLPLLDYEDGYGWSYGVQIAKTKVLGADSRLSFPLTWGGTRQAAAQVEKLFDGGQTRVEAGAGVIGRTNPFFQQDDDRRRVWVRAERAVAPQLRVGGTAGWQHVTFMNAGDRFTHVGADVTFDTRLDPFLARNAVYARASVEHLDFAHAAAANRTELEGRGYIGLAGQNILVVRALRQDSDVPLPGYLQPMLGGMANLRGFEAGSAIGDTLVAGTAEIRAPLTSPLGIAKAGVSAFVDIGTVYDKGQRLADQHFERGIGGGVWFTAAFLRLSLYVAHGAQGTGAGTRVHFGTSVTF